MVLAVVTVWIQMTSSVCSSSTAVQGEVTLDMEVSISTISSEYR